MGCLYLLDKYVEELELWSAQKYEELGFAFFFI